MPRLRRKNAVPIPGASDLFKAVEADPKFRRAMAIIRAEERARALYREIASELGHEEALRIFANWREPSKKQRDALNNSTMLMLYEMWGRPRKNAFAEKIVEINRTSSRENRLGTRGSCAAETIRKQLSRLLSRQAKTKRSKKAKRRNG